MCATLVTHPLDTLKVRAQLLGELRREHHGLGARELARSVRHIVRSEGAAALYAGISAALLRHATFSTLRHGGFACCCAQLASPGSRRGEQHPSSALTMQSSVACAAVVGLVSAVVAQPCDLVLVRMQADGANPASRRRAYRHAVHGIRTVARTEGVRRLWTGCAPTVARGVAVTLTQLPTYHLAKEALLGLDERDFVSFPGGSNDPLVHVLAALASAMAAAVCTTPVDVVKTRVINAGPSGPYTSAAQCARLTLRAEGVRGLFKGLLPTFVRLWPHTTLLWLSQEAILRSLR